MKKPKLMAKERTTKAINLPSDVLLDLPKLHYDGIGLLQCENYKKIIEYSQTCLRFSTSAGEVKVIGNKLLIKNFILQEITCSGDIKSIEFINKNTSKHKFKI